MNKRKQILIFAACLIFHLPGCGTPYKKTVISYNEAKICCKSMDEFHYEDINIGQTKEFPINENSQAFVFDSGKSYFKAFKLPRSSQGYRVKIDSYALQSFSEGPAGDYIFYPVLITLNKNYNIVQISNLGQFNLLKNTIKDQPSGTSFIYWQNAGFKLRGHLIISEKSNEEYIVILTTDELMKRNIVFLIGGEIALPSSLAILYPQLMFKREKTIKISPHGAIAISLSLDNSESPGVSGRPFSLGTGE